jgi:F0F1-type ATP synthase alpha subunit
MASMGLALNLEETQVGVVLLGDYTEIREGDQVRRTRRYYGSSGWRRNGGQSGECPSPAH